MNGKKRYDHLKTKTCRICQFSIIYENINFVIEISSRAHFKDNLRLIKNWIGTIPIKSFFFLFTRLNCNQHENCKNRKAFKKYKKMTVFTDIVPIQSFISAKLSLKWALDEVSTTKLMFHYIAGKWQILHVFVFKWL